MSAVTGGDGQGPLAGMCVLDLSTLFAAPQVAAMLGDLGADVIRVEHPTGDPLRRMGAQRDGHSLMWALANRNKRCVTLDLGAAAGYDVLRRLLAHTDVLVENAPTTALRDWHCTYPELAAVRPELVVVSVTCYGRSGPYAERPGAGTLAEAFGGLTHMTGEADGPPTLPSIALGDTMTALVGVIGALAASYHRVAHGGGGQHIDVSMYEPILQLMAPTLVAYQQGDPIPTRNGSRVRGGAPRNVYRCRDARYLVVSGTTDAQVARMLDLLGIDDAAERASFATSPARLEHADELDRLVAEWIADKTADIVLERLLRARIPAAPVNDVAEILADPQVQARADVVTVEDPVLGPLAMVAPPFRLSATAAGIRSTGPTLGEHNAEVFGGLLDMSPDEVDRLRVENVI